MFVGGDNSDTLQVKEIEVRFVRLARCSAVATALRQILEAFGGLSDIVLYTQGDQSWCVLREVEKLKTMLMRLNLLRRFHEPSIILRQHERIIQAMIALTAPAAVDTSR